MLSIAERHKYILDKLNEYGFIRITDVVDELGVTKVTSKEALKLIEKKSVFIANLYYVETEEEANLLIKQKLTLNKNMVKNMLV